jgi:hypothetical protein
MEGISTMEEARICRIPFSWMIDSSYAQMYFLEFSFNMLHPPPLHGRRRQTLYPHDDDDMMMMSVFLENEQCQLTFLFQRLVIHAAMRYGFCESNHHKIVMIYTGILGTTTWSRTHGMAAWTKCCLFVCHDGTDA